MTFHLDPEAFQAEYEDEQAILRQLAEEMQRVLIIGLLLDLALAMLNADLAERGEDTEPEGDLFDIVREHEENDVPLDGDAESALASAGMGTDEDYGGTHDWEDGGE